MLLWCYCTKTGVWTGLTFDVPGSDLASVLPGIEVSHHSADNGMSYSAVVSGNYGISEGEILPFKWRTVSGFKWGALASSSKIDTKDRHENGRAVSVITTMGSHLLYCYIVVVTSDIATWWLYRIAHDGQTLSLWLYSGLPLMWPPKSGTKGGLIRRVVSHLVSDLRVSYRGGGEGCELLYRGVT